MKERQKEINRKKKDTETKVKSQIKKRKDNGKEGRKREHVGREGKRGGAASCMLWSWKPD